MAAMQPRPDDVVTMPRRLAVRLLHAAQLAQERPFKALVVSASETALPDAMLPLDEDWEAASAKAALLAKGRYPWALYWHRPNRPDAPRPDEFELGPASLCLTSSLAMKGVLRLYGWRCDAECRVHAVTVRVRD